MGDATATIKRKFKTTKERIKKSEVVQDLKLKIAKKNIQDKEVTYKGKDNKDITTKITTLIKTFEKEIKEYEKKWEKEAKSNKFYKTFAKYEPYYKKTKANVIPSKNASKYVVAFDTYAIFYNNKALLYTPFYVFKKI